MIMVVLFTALLTTGCARTLYGIAGDTAENASVAWKYTKESIHEATAPNPIIVPIISVSSDKWYEW